MRTHQLTTVANLLRTARSGKNWTKAELGAYSISFVSQTQVKFFEIDDFPSTTPSLFGFMTNESLEMATATATDKVQTLRYLDLTVIPKLLQEVSAAHVSFTIELLQGLDYGAFVRPFLPSSSAGRT